MNYSLTLSDGVKQSLHSGEYDLRQLLYLYQELKRLADNPNIAQYYTLGGGLFTTYSRHIGFDLTWFDVWFQRDDQAKRIRVDAVIIKAIPPGPH